MRNFWPGYSRYRPNSAPPGVVFGLLLSALLGFFNQVDAAEYAVIANRGVSISSLTRQEAQAIFTGEKTRLEDGKSIRIVVLQGGEASRSFLQQVLGKTPSQFDIYWKKLIFTGKAGAPRTFDSPSAVVRYVASTPGALGFVGSSDVTGQVKTISVR